MRSVDQNGSGRRCPSRVRANGKSQCCFSTRRGCYLRMPIASGQWVAACRPPFGASLSDSCLCLASLQVDMTRSNLFRNRAGAFAALPLVRVWFGWGRLRPHHALRGDLGQRKVQAGEPTVMSTRAVGTCRAWCAADRVVQQESWFPLISPVWLRGANRWIAWHRGWASIALLDSPRARMQRKLAGMTPSRHGSMLLPGLYPRPRTPDYLERADRLTPVASSAGQD